MPPDNAGEDPRVGRSLARLANLLDRGGELVEDFAARVLFHTCSGREIRILRKYNSRDVRKYQHVLHVPGNTFQVIEKMKYME